MADTSSRLRSLTQHIMGSYTPVVPDISSLVTKLTLEEKVSLLAGQDFWQTHSVDRLNIPVLKTSDGPNGARGGLFKGGLSSACFPASVSLAATFDRSLARRVGRALAQETRTKGASVLLGPTVCPHRDPRGGRNFESFSEDPLLAGELAAEYIRGLQEQGVGATIKHYAVNESETKRFTIDACLSERALREIYLKPFEIAVKKADPWALMTSYNLVNGTHADMNRFLITQVLRKEWGFKGLVMSDWGGTNSTAESLNAGHDLEMPGPPVRRTVKKIKEAIETGELTEDTINQRVYKNLELLVKTDKFTNPETPPEQAIDLPEHRSLIRHAGAEGMVLLKNENNTLPIQPAKIKSIALLGLAKEFLGHGGGSAAVNAHHKITPFDALYEALGSDVELRYAEGARILRNLKAWKQDVYNEDGVAGYTNRIYTSSAETPKVKDEPASNFMMLEDPTLTHIVMTGTYKPTVSGNHYVSLATVGNTTIHIDGEEFFKVEGPSADIMAFLLGTASEDRKQYTFKAGQEYKIKIEAKALVGTQAELTLLANPLVGFNLGFAHQDDFEADLLTSAVEIAKSSDLAIVFVGNTPTWETEGCDRDSMDLPMNGSLDRLVRACSAVNKNTIIVNSSGSPITMPWIDQVQAVLQAWFPGQEAGYAIADVLLGKVNPAGKLPVTFPKKIEHAPTFDNFPHTGPLKDLHVDYEEDIFIGYRHYDRQSNNVLFPFGFGLSYTTFDVSDVQCDQTNVAADSVLEVRAKVSNTGTVKGDQVVQIYVGPAESNACVVERPRKTLTSWTKVKNLAPGQSQTVEISVPLRDGVQYWDESSSQWVVPKGSYQLYIATSSAKKDIVHTLNVEIAQQATFKP